jgi:hypothetical protein
MDEEAAIAEAQRRWGSRGAVSIADQWRKARCLVGELREGPRFVVRGRGSTWEAAFNDAEARLLNASRRQSDRQVPRVRLQQGWPADDGSLRES